MIPRVCCSSKNEKEETYLKFVLPIECILLAQTDTFFCLFTKVINKSKTDPKMLIWVFQVNKSHALKFNYQFPITLLMYFIFMSCFFAIHDIIHLSPVFHQFNSSNCLIICFGAVVKPLNISFTLPRKSLISRP